MPDRHSHAYIVILAGALLCACDPAPTEEMPVLVTLAIPGAAADWVDVPRSQADSYAVLPAPRVRLTLDASMPGSLVVTAVDPTTGMTAELPAIRAGQDEPTGGFYRVDSIDSQARPARWSVTVSPPEGFSSLTTYRISVAHKYGNAVSSPLMVTLAGGPQS
jgi:hypothetical protein